MPTLSGGTVHRLHPELKAALTASPKLAAFWNGLTPLARNEWICWMTEAKMAETRERRLKVGLDKMTKGMRRPCCWAGCLHRSSRSE